MQHTYLLHLLSANSKLFAGISFNSVSLRSSYSHTTAFIHVFSVRP